MSAALRNPRGETRFPGITRHARELGCSRPHLYLVLTGQRRDGGDLLPRYKHLLKSEGRNLPRDLKSA